MLVQCLFSLSLSQFRSNIDKSFSLKTILYNFRVKSPITKIIEDNIFECMAYQFYILLLFGFEFDFQNKKKNCSLKLSLNCFEIIIRKKLIYVPLKNIVLYRFYGGLFYSRI